MGVFDLGVMVMRGTFDVFDRAEGVIEDIEEMLPPIEYHGSVKLFGDHIGHFYDPAEEERLRLDYAVSLIREACQIAMDVMKGVE